MLDARVRDAGGREIGQVNDIIVGLDGRVHRVVVEVGGLAELGDQHIPVPWGDLRIARGMEWIGTPLREIRDGTFALHGATHQGERVSQPPGAWRVSERVGRVIEADGGERGEVVDVLFDDAGYAQALVVDRGDERYGYLKLP